MKMKQSHSDKVFDNEERSCCVDISLDKLKDLGLEVHLGLNDLHIYLDPVGSDEFDRLVDAIPEHMCEEDQDELHDAISKAFNHIVIKRLFTRASKMKVRK